MIKKIHLLVIKNPLFLTFKINEINKIFCGK